MAAPAPAVSFAQQNLAARNLVLNMAVDRIQQIYQNTITTGAGSVLNIPLRNVGLVKRLFVKVAATVDGETGTTLTLTEFGTANIFSSVILSDTANFQRINCPSWYLTYLASFKGRTPFGSAILEASQDTPFGFGANFTKVQTAPTTITADAASNNVFAMFEIPLAYSDSDLRGALYMGVVNATANLQLTVNPNFLVSSSGNLVDAVYKSGGAITGCSVSSLTVTVYQQYLDQLPASSQGFVLPMGDLSVNYLLQTTAISGLTQAIDNSFPYVNFRDILSTTMIYDNAGVLNAGTDINYFALRTANVMDLFNITPQEVALFTRQRMRVDSPKGLYYFDHRARPINTNQYGNMELVMNASTVTSSASNVRLGYEMFAVVNNITASGSLPSS